MHFLCRELTDHKFLVSRNPVDTELAEAARQVQEMHREIYAAALNGRDVSPALATSYRDHLKKVIIGVKEDKSGRIKAFVDRYLCDTGEKSELVIASLQKMGLPTKGFDKETIKELKTLGCMACGECRWEGNAQGTFANLPCAVTPQGKVCRPPSANEHYRYWVDRFQTQGTGGPPGRGRGGARGGARGGYAHCHARHTWG